jgi:hypothetical protein
MRDKITPEIILHAGYNLPITDENYSTNPATEVTVKGSLYYAAGIGVVLKPLPLVFSIIYKSGKSTYTFKDVDLDSVHFTSADNELDLTGGIRF